MHWHEQSASIHVWRGEGGFCSDGHAALAPGSQTQPHASGPENKWLVSSQICLTRPSSHVTVSVILQYPRARHMVVSGDMPGRRTASSSATWLGRISAASSSLTMPLTKTCTSGTPPASADWAAAGGATPATARDAGGVGGMLMYPACSVRRLCAAA